MHAQCPGLRQVINQRNAHLRASAQGTSKDTLTGVGRKHSTEQTRKHTHTRTRNTHAHAHTHTLLDHTPLQSVLGPFWPGMLLEGAKVMRPSTSVHWVACIFLAQRPTPGSRQAVIRRANWASKTPCACQSDLFQATMRSLIAHCPVALLTERKHPSPDAHLRGQSIGSERRFPETLFVPSCAFHTHLKCCGVTVLTNALCC